VELYRLTPGIVERADTKRFMSDKMHQ